MKRKTALLLSFVMTCTLAACDKEEQNLSQNQSPVQAPLTQNHSESSPLQKDIDNSNDALQILYKNNAVSPYCTCENGCYYITTDDTELKDGSYGRHIMYIDFETQQEIYLCGSPGCTHDMQTCTSVLSQEDFLYDSTIFYYGNLLFVLSKEYDDDGSMQTNYISDISDTELPYESPAAALYCMNPDGTGRTKVYEFDADLTIEDIVIGKSSDLYFVVKKNDAEKIGSTGSTSYTTSSDRRLIKINTADWKSQTVYQFPSSKNDIKWSIVNSFGSCLVLHGIAYDHPLTETELFDDDAYLENYKKSKSQYAVLDLENPEIQVVFSISTEEAMGASLVEKDEFLYMSLEGNPAIRQINLITKEERILAELENNNIWYAFDDVLCCTSWNSDSTLYFVNRQDGSISHSGLTNQSLGWMLDFRGEISDKFLVIYDYDAIPYPDDSYDITQYYYALITKEDLYKGNENYLPIKMISKGE